MKKNEDNITLLYLNQGLAQQIICLHLEFDQNVELFIILQC